MEQFGSSSGSCPEGCRFKSCLRYMLREKIQKIMTTHLIFNQKYMGAILFENNKDLRVEDIKVAFERDYGWVVPVKTIKAFM